MLNNCRICGRLLTDPISIKLGIGPVCRIRIKNVDAQEKSGNMFSNRSDYDYRIDGNVIAIEDLGGYKSVTNDIENILQDFIFLEIDIYNKKTKIMYKDSMGIWDGIRIMDPGSLRFEFFSLNERLYLQAKAKLNAAK